ncbi:MAG: hypothetical protein V4673_17435 [Pseudomonadota bacterium]
MQKKKIIASTAAAATIAVVLLFLILAKPGSGALDVSIERAASVGGGNHLGEGSAGVESAKRLAADEAAAGQLLMEFDSYIARIMSGDDSLDGTQRMNMMYKLEQAVEFSPALRAALKRKLQDTFKSGQITALMELERAFNGSEVGVTELIDIYAEEAKSGGALDYYALQNASYTPGAISEETKKILFQSAFSQMQKYSEHNKYNGAMLFFASMARSGLPVEEQDRNKAISLIQDKLYSAGEGEDQYFAAQNLYKLMSAQDSAIRATSILEERPTFPVAQATLEAIVHGRMAVDPALIQVLMRFATQQSLTQDQSRTLQELLARVPSNEASSGNRHGG